MPATPGPRLRLSWTSLAVVAGLLSVAVVWGSASPAGAAATCDYEPTIFGETITVRTDVDIDLAVRGRVLLVNDTPCGELTQVTSIFTSARVDVFVDFSSDWHYRGGGVPTTINVFDMPSGSRLTLRGGDRSESVTWSSDDVPGARGYAAMHIRDRATDEGIVSVVVHDRSRADLEFRLGAGRDHYTYTNERVGYRSKVRINGGPGRDRIDAGPGRQRIYGGTGGDVINGGPGKDRIQGGGGRDVVDGGRGSDRFFMVDGRRDVVDGGTGNDQCVCDERDRRRNI